MAKQYKVIGAEWSPYSVKVRSYFRFKGIPHEWIVSTTAAREEYKEHFKLPLVPLVLTPDDRTLQDSTPMIEALEAEFAEPTIYPQNDAMNFISMLLEEFSDEWANKWMFHTRWARDVDQQSGAVRIAQLVTPDADEQTLAVVATKVRERMTGRVWFVGSNEQNAAEIEAGLASALEQLERHLTNRAYLLGGTPSLADFGLSGQLYCLSTDPTPAALIGSRYPAVLAWIQRMLWPTTVGAFEDWRDLQPTLLPFLLEHVGRKFLPWTAANAQAILSGDEEFTVQLGEHQWTQKPQKYHAKSFAVLRERYQTLDDRAELDAILGEADCLSWLQA